MTKDERDICLEILRAELDAGQLGSEIDIFRTADGQVYGRTSTGNRVRYLVPSGRRTQFIPQPPDGIPIWHWSAGNYMLDEEWWSMAESLAEDEPYAGDPDVDYDPTPNPNYEDVEYHLHKLICEELRDNWEDNHD